MFKKRKNTYFSNLWYGLRSSWIGLRLTIRHAWQANKRRMPFAVQDVSYFEQKTGIVTLQYPFEAIPVPDNGRYRLYNEIEDCIVCDKCAKVCPVDCIEIEAIKATEQIGTTADGSPIRLYASKFDIDMGKCCFCGLCTTVCPTECLTMTKVYDFSEYEIENMNYHFSNLSPEQAQEKIQLLELFQKEKAFLKQKPIEIEDNDLQNIEPKKTAFKPKFKSTVKTEDKIEETEKKDSIEIKNNVSNDNELKNEDLPAEVSSKPKFKPKMVIKKVSEASPLENKSDEEKDIQDENNLSLPESKPIFKPKMKSKPIIKPNSDEDNTHI